MPSEEQMDVRDGDDQRVWVLFDIEDAMERMLGTLTLLVLTGQIENLLLVRLDEIPAHRDESSRIIVPDSLAGLADYLVRIHRPGLQPLPAPILEDGIAHRTDAWLRWSPGRCAMPSSRMGAGNGWS